MSIRDFFSCGYSSVLCGYFYMFPAWLSLGSQAAIPAFFSGYFFCPLGLSLISSSAPLASPLSLSLGTLLSGYSYCFWLSLAPSLAAIPVIFSIAYGYPSILRCHSCDLLYFFCLSLHPQRMLLRLAIIASSAAIPVISCISFGNPSILSGYSCGSVLLSTNRLTPNS